MINCRTKNGQVAIIITKREMGYEDPLDSGSLAHPHHDSPMVMQTYYWLLTNDPYYSHFVNTHVTNDYPDFKYAVNGSSQASLLESCCFEEKEEEVSDIEEPLIEIDFAEDFAHCGVFKDHVDLDDVDYSFATIEQIYNAIQEVKNSVQ